MLATCDARYNFVLIDVGAEGRNSDGGIFRTSEINKCLENGSLSFPDAKPLNEARFNDVPYFMVGDEAFPLETYMMRPFFGRSSGRLSVDKAIYNYRLSRARRCIENAFGIMAGRFRIFRKPIIASEETARAITLACVVLHNFIKSFEDNLPAEDRRYASPEFVDRLDSHGNILPGLWRRQSHCFVDMEHDSRDTNHSAEEVRNILKDYFLHDGAVPWQQETILFNQH